MNAIAAVDRNWGIGKDGHLLVRIPEDQRVFKALTYGKTVVMGRKTLESLPRGEPLEGRKNIVLSTCMEERDGIVVCKSILELFEIIEKKDPNVFVIGGESVYEQLLPYCERAYITKINADFPHDCSFPNLDKSGIWEKYYESAIQNHNGILYRFCLFGNKLADMIS